MIHISSDAGPSTYDRLINCPIHHYHRRFWQASRTMKPSRIYRRRSIHSNYRLACIAFVGVLIECSRSRCRLRWCCTAVDARSHPCIISERAAYSPSVRLPRMTWWNPKMHDQREVTQGCGMKWRFFHMHIHLYTFKKQIVGDKAILYHIL